MNKLFSRVFYWVLKKYASLALHVYFKKVQVVGKENMPKNAPIIIAANHQNAFLDAMLIASFLGRKPYFLTQAGVFKNKLANRFLRSLNMIPIYRFRDGMGNMKKNDQVLETCTNLLLDNQAILIFPEGNHDLRWMLRPLQKGITRMLFAAENERGFGLGSKVVPVGIQYESHSKFRSKVLLTVGNSIKTCDYKKDYLTDEKLGAKNLLAHLKSSIQSMIVDVEPAKSYDEIVDQWRSMRTIYDDLAVQLEEDKRLIAAIKSGEYIPEKKEIMPPSFVSKILKIVFFPITFYVWVNHLVPIYTIKYTLKKLIEDQAFVGSLKLAIGMFLTPPVYLFQTWVFYLISGSVHYSLLYFISLPLTGLIYLLYRDTK